METTSKIHEMARLVISSLDMHQYYVTITQVHLINIDRLPVQLMWPCFDQNNWPFVWYLHVTFYVCGHEIVFNLRSCRVQTIDMVDRDGARERQIDREGEGEREELKWSATYSGYVKSTNNVFANVLNCQRAHELDRIGIKRTHELVCGLKKRQQESKWHKNCRYWSLTKVWGRFLQQHKIMEYIFSVGFIRSKMPNRKAQNCYQLRRMMSFNLLAI